jgi:hypothetical protein
MARAHAADSLACEDPPENSRGVASAVAPIAPKAASGPGDNHAEHHACKRAAARASLQTLIIVGMTRNCGAGD